MAAQGFALSISGIKETDEDFGEKANQLIKLQNSEFLIPETFLITSKAYHEFIKSNNLDKKISHLLGTVDLGKPKSIKDIASNIEKYITKSDIPNHVMKEILSEYKKLGGVLSHAKANIILSHVKNGLETHEISGDASLIDKIKSHWLSIYSPGSPKTNPTLVIQKIVKGKNGRIRTSTKQIKTPFNLTKKDIELLENLVSKIKKNLYFPHEIDWVIDGNSVYVLKLVPETPSSPSTFFPETHFSITHNSHSL